MVAYYLNGWLSFPLQPSSRHSNYRSCPADGRKCLLKLVHSLKGDRLCFEGEGKQGQTGSHRHPPLDQPFLVSVSGGGWGGALVISEGRKIAAVLDRMCMLSSVLS